MKANTISFICNDTIESPCIRDSNCICKSDTNKIFKGHISLEYGSDTIYFNYIVKSLYNFLKNKKFFSNFIKIKFFYLTYFILFFYAPNLVVLPFKKIFGFRKNRLISLPYKKNKKKMNFSEGEHKKIEYGN